MRRATRRIALTTAGLVAGSALLSIPGMGQNLRFLAGDWLTECVTAIPASNCSLTGVFNGVDNWGTAGSFAVVVGVETLLVAVVGQPSPVRATLRIDKYPPVQCTGPRYCVFNEVDALKLVQELSRGAVILIDVFTRNGTFQLSLSTKGYREGLAKIEAASQ